MRSGNRILNERDIVIKEKTYVSLESKMFRHPLNVSLEDFSNLLDIKFNTPNVNLNVFDNQDVSINLPPNTQSVDTKLELAIDDNYLYIWVKDRWKRISLSDF